MLRRPLALAFMVVAATVCSKTAAAQAPWVRQINAQLISSPFVQTAVARDFSITHDPYYSLIPSGGSDAVTLTLAYGRTYRIVAKCDNDCTDVDLKLFDSYGNLVDQDTGTDDYPVVSVTPARTSTYRLRIQMYRCATVDCGVGVVVLGR